MQNGWIGQKTLRELVEKGVISVPRERIVKYPPKRGKFSRRELSRAVDEVVRARLEAKGIEVSKPKRKTVHSIEVRRDAVTGRFASRKESERPGNNVTVETVKRRTMKRGSQTRKSSGEERKTGREERG